MSLIRAVTEVFIIYRPNALIPLTIVNLQSFPSDI